MMAEARIEEVQADTIKVLGELVMGAKKMEMDRGTYKVVGYRMAAPGQYRIDGQVNNG